MSSLTVYSIETRVLKLVFGTIWLIAWSIWSIFYVQHIHNYGWSQWWDLVLDLNIMHISSYMLMTFYAFTTILRVFLQKLTSILSWNQTQSGNQICIWETMYGQWSLRTVCGTGTWVHHSMFRRAIGMFRSMWIIYAEDGSCYRQSRRLTRFQWDTHLNWTHLPCLILPWRLIISIK